MTGQEPTGGAPRFRCEACNDEMHPMFERSHVVYCLVAEVLAQSALERELQRMGLNPR